MPHPLSPDATDGQHFSSAGQVPLDWLTLTFFPGIGCTLVNRLVREFGSPDRVLAARREQLSAEGLNRKTASAITDPGQVQNARERARREIEKISAMGDRVICPDDPDYPSGLADMADPPAVLFCRGNKRVLKKPAVAIVGSRAATAYGKRVSYELARELARHGVCVVSGMAMGIDGQAHAGALDGGGETIGVLGCGLDITYPHQHAALFSDVGEQGLLLSEYPLGTPPEGFRFPERNRIISGLSLGVVVVEASLKSGSLITARLALDQGREVFAVPGRIDSPKSRGPHLLLQQGAKLVTGVDDIMEELELAGALDRSGDDKETELQPVVLDPEEKHLLSCLEVYPVSIDELVRASGYDAAAVFRMLLRFELLGMVRQLPGQLYERNMQGPDPSS